MGSGTVIACVASGFLASTACTAAFGVWIAWSGNWRKEISALPVSACIVAILLASACAGWACQALPGAGLGIVGGLPLVLAGLRDLRRGAVRTRA